MADRPQMPVPQGELSPRELLKEIEEWAENQGYETTFHATRNESGKVVVTDPDGGSTFTNVPNAHRGRRLRKDQVR